MARLDRLIQDYLHDPYFVKEKYHNPSVCTKCNVVFHEGIFEWLDTPPKDAEKMICPACRRITEHYPGGEVVLEGVFLKEHKAEVESIINRAEELEKARRPLERIVEMSIEYDRIEVKTTYEHLARRIGESVHRAFKGELKLRYLEDDKFIRVYWRRD